MRFACNKNPADLRHARFVRRARNLGRRQSYSGGSALSGNDLMLRAVKRTPRMKKWAKEIAPSERPAFLFDELERDAHAGISAEAYQALQASLEAKSDQLVVSGPKRLT